jgi:hypothetical protein
MQASARLNLMHDPQGHPLRDWLRLQPLAHGFKRLRDDFAQRLFLRMRPAELESFLRHNAHLEGHNIALIVAFEAPWALEWMLRAAAQHLEDATLVVCDNSRPGPLREEIRSTCARLGIAYLALPRNPTRHANRSHGRALTWIYHNVVRALRPARFAFLDHDLIPLQRVALFRHLGTQPFYGVANAGHAGWSLWAGYCAFDFAHVSGLPLNFLHDFPRGLDTGGRNWPMLYRHHQQAQLHFASLEYFDLVDPASGERQVVQWIDESWLHLFGTGYRDPKGVFGKRIAQAVELGLDVRELMKPPLNPPASPRATTGPATT